MLRSFRRVLKCALSFTFVLTPAISVRASSSLSPQEQQAFATQAQQAVKDFLKRKPMTKPMTWKQFLTDIHKLPKVWQPIAEDILKQVGDQKLPKIDIYLVNSPQGGFYRMTANDGEAQYIMDMVGTQEVMFRFNGRALSGSEMQTEAGLERLRQIVESVPGKKTRALASEKKIFRAPSPQEWEAWTVEQKLEWMKSYRGMLIDLEILSAPKRQNVSSTLFEILFAEFLTEAWAMPKTGDACVAGGFVLQYGINDKGRLSCGYGEDRKEVPELAKARTEAGCSPVQLPCNRMLFGSGAGCVSSTDPQQVTKSCDSQFGVERLKKDFIDEAAKAKTTAERTALVEKINKQIRDMLGVLKSAGTLCGFEATPLLNTNADTTKPMVLGYDIKVNENGAKDLLPDQQEACGALKQRVFKLQLPAGEPVAIAPRVVPKEPEKPEEVIRRTQSPPRKVVEPTEEDSHGGSASKNWIRGAGMLGIAALSIGGMYLGQMQYEANAKAATAASASYFPYAIQPLYMPPSNYSPGGVYNTPAQR